MVKEFFSNITSSDILLLSIGLALGVAVLMLIRGRQVWQNRYAYGHDSYSADSLRRRLFGWAGIAGVLVLVIGVTYFARETFFPDTTALLDGTTIEEETLVDEQVDLGAMSLVIPQLGLELEMVEAPFVAKQWDISRLTDEVAHLAGTSYPGMGGNTVLAGHVTIPGSGWGPFQELETLEIGDHMFVQSEGLTLTYEVFENMVVDPSAIEVVFPTEDQRLTLITCTGWNGALDSYTQRIVVIARLIPTP